jgi:hypothetical protein
MTAQKINPHTRMATAIAAAHDPCQRLMIRGPSSVAGAGNPTRFQSSTVLWEHPARRSADTEPSAKTAAFRRPPPAVIRLIEPFQKPTAT